MSKYEELQKYITAHHIITDLQCAAKMTTPPSTMPKERVTFLRKALFKQSLDMACKRDKELMNLFYAAAREMLFDKLFIDSDFENLENFKPTEQQELAMGIAEMMFGGLFKNL